MIPPLETVSVGFILGMLSGVGPDSPNALAWLRDARIPRERLDEPSARVTLTQCEALYTKMLYAMNDEVLGTLDRPYRVGAMSMCMRATIGASTLKHALNRMTHAHRLIQDGLYGMLTEEGGHAVFRMVINDPKGARNPFLFEAYILLVWRLIVFFHGAPLRPRRFEFAFPKPMHSSDYVRVFGGPVRFDAATTGIWFDASALSTPYVRDIGAIEAFIRRAPANLFMVERARSTTSARVRDHLRRQLPDWVDLVATAAALNTSPSTLQRHLTAEGTTFKNIRDQLRRDLAVIRLQSSDMPIKVLALELGFSDGPSFQRAFKGWTGSAPGDYRRSGARMTH